MPDKFLKALDEAIMKIAIEMTNDGYQNSEIEGFIERRTELAIIEMNC